MNSTLTRKDSAEKIIDISHNVNEVQTKREVHPLFQTHYADTKNEIFGIEQLLISIFKSHDAVMQKSLDDTDLRQVAIAKALFTNEIHNEVQARFSADTTRYSIKSILQYLGGFMTKSGKVGKIELKGFEDQNRSCYKPRCKWYLVQSQTAR